MKSASLIMVLMAICALVGCYEPPSQLVVDKEPGERLTDNAPLEGRCVGWQKSLAKGRKVYEVEACLREKAIVDRTAATLEAATLNSWRIKDGYDSELNPLVAALLQFPDPASIKQFLDSEGLLPNPPGEYSTLEKALTVSDYIKDLGNIYWFDVETGMFPNNHDYLLAEIAALSDLKSAKFYEDAPVDWDADEEPYQLSADFNGKHYQRMAKNYGDWYDLDAVLWLLNHMAMDNKVADRFVTLNTGDQTAIVWIVDRSILTSLTERGLLSFSPADLPREVGKGFEDAVRDQLENPQ